tara:strand:- start:490 stop:1275 length:786 start_codon:yes stop_codon:yes gene_type:complete
MPGVVQSLSGKRAIVCGASRGIGAACAKSLAELGCSVVLLARNYDAMESLIKELPGSNHEVLAVDLGDPDSLTKAVSGLVDRRPVNILINNSGGPKAGPLLEASERIFVEGLQNHVLASQLLVNLCLEGMKTTQYGRIIQIISTSVKAPIPNLGVSNTIRGAVASWSKSLSNELGQYGITVNNVLPGYTNTERLQELIKSASSRQGISENKIIETWKDKVPLGRFAEAEEVANAVTFLASPGAAYITGINLPVDGGRTPSL